jgi:hypothetical protein
MSILQNIAIVGLDIENANTIDLAIQNIYLYLTCLFPTLYIFYVFSILPCIIQSACFINIQEVRMGNQNILIYSKSSAVSTNFSPLGMNYGLLQLVLLSASLTTYHIIMAPFISDYLLWFKRSINDFSYSKINTFIKYKSTFYIRKPNFYLHNYRNYFLAPQPCNYLTLPTIILDTKLTSPINMNMVYVTNKIYIAKYYNKFLDPQASTEYYNHKSKSIKSLALCGNKSNSIKSLALCGNKSYDFSGSNETFDNNSLLLIKDTPNLLSKHTYNKDLFITNHISMVRKNLNIFMIRSTDIHGHSPIFPVSNTIDIRDISRIYTFETLNYSDLRTNYVKLNKEYWHWAGLCYSDLSLLAIDANVFTIAKEIHNLYLSLHNRHLDDHIIGIVDALEPHRMVTIFDFPPYKRIMVSENISRVSQNISRVYLLIGLLETQRSRMSHEDIYSLKYAKYWIINDQAIFESYRSHYCNVFNQLFKLEREI